MYTIIVYQCNHTCILHVHIHNAWIQCVKLTAATSPTAAKNHPIATKFAFPGALLGDHHRYRAARGVAWRVDVHTLIATCGDDSGERMKSLEQFGFVRCSATTSSAVTPLHSDDVLNSEDLTALPSKRKRFNSDWVEGHMWLRQHEHSREHKDAEAVQCASTRPYCSLMELAIQTDCGTKRGWTDETSFQHCIHLVETECPFHDFPALLQLQGLNGLHVGRAYRR